MLAACRVFLAALLLVLPIWVVAATPAYACSCLPTTLEERVSRADLIVVGTAGEIQLLGPLPTPEPLSPPSKIQFGSGGPGEVTIAVEENVKGIGPDTLLVFEYNTSVQFGPDGQIHVLPVGGTTCGAFDQLGGRHLLFLGQREDGRYDTSVCSGSTDITSANEASVLARIEQIKQILQGPTPTVSGFPEAGVAGVGSDDAGDASLWPAVAAGGAGALLASAALFAFRRPGANDES